MPELPRVTDRQEDSTVAETPLTLGQMLNVIDRKGGDIPRVPLFWHKFWGMGTAEKYGQELTDFAATIVDDCVDLRYLPPGDFAAPEDAEPGYRWAIEEMPEDYAERGITSRRPVSSVELIDSVVEQMPDPSPQSYFEGAAGTVKANPDRYTVAWDFFCLFERAWFLFGMEEIMCEMLLNPERMKRLLRAFTDYHKTVIDGFAEAGAHGYFTSDDLGSQQALLFSREAFRELYLPCYEELVDHCHARGMHFWLHSCGAIDEIMPDIVSIGVDVVHPIQQGAMDQQAVADEYRGKITFLAGIDVQDLLPWGTADEVEAGTRTLIDTFDSNFGGCIASCGNGIMPETPMANIRAWLTTAEGYGREKRRR